MGSKVCQICSDTVTVGTTVDGKPLVACDVCSFPVLSVASVMSKRGKIVISIALNARPNTNGTNASSV